MKNDDLPLLTLIRVADHDDGSSTVEFEANDAFIKYYLKQTGKKRVTNKGLSNFILNIIKESIDKDKKTIIK